MDDCEIGLHKRFLGYGYQQIALDVEAVRRVAEVVVELNGHKIVDVDGKSHPEILKRSPRGPVGFQNHGTPIWFRNIRLADFTEDRKKPHR